MNFSSSRLGWLVAAAVLLIAWLAPLGDLNPPAGPVTPTMKPLSQVEPRTPISATTTPGTVSALFRITAPGSYYLIGNITGVAGKCGIEIASPQVSLDLCGFTLRGVPGSTAGLLGTGPDVQDIEVGNGTVREWGADGIDLSLGENVLLHDLHLTDNTADGVTVHGPGVMRSCAVRSNDGKGIDVIGGTFVVQGCAVSANLGNGIVAGNSSEIVDCVVDGNGGDGIVLTLTSSVRDCTLDSNTGDAIEIGLGNFVEGNAIKLRNNSTGAGIHATNSGNRISGNTVTLDSSSHRGIDVDSNGSLVVGNSVTGSASNYDIVGGNTVGTIVTTSAAMNAAANALVNISF